LDPLEKAFPDQVEDNNSGQFDLAPIIIARFDPFCPAQAVRRSAVTNRYNLLHTATAEPARLMVRVRGGMLAMTANACELEPGQGAEVLKV
jgi:hypothetical protein